MTRIILKLNTATSSQTKRGYLKNRPWPQNVKKKLSFPYVNFRTKMLILMTLTKPQNF
jgi:hypothetical protein